MIARPREIDNPATGETARFIRTAEETGGELLVIENRWTQADHVVPPHLHPKMEERWQILEGRVGFRVGGDELVAEQGTAVTAAPGVPHTAWNDGAGPALIRIELRPALRWEEFVRQLFALAGEDFQDDTAERSVQELLSEFAPEIQLPANPDSVRGRRARSAS